MHSLQMVFVCLGGLELKFLKTWLVTKTQKFDKNWNIQCRKQNIYHFINFQSLKTKQSDIASKRGKFCTKTLENKKKKKPFASYNSTIATKKTMSNQIKWNFEFVLEYKLLYYCIIQCLWKKKCSVSWRILCVRSLLACKLHP